MELAKVTSKGQITVPKKVRDDLNLDEGDKLMFVKESPGVYRVMSPVLAAFLEAQKAFEGIAEQYGLKDEDDVMRLVEEVRAEIRAEQEQ